MLTVMLILGFMYAVSIYAIITSNRINTPTCHDYAEPHRWARNVLTDELVCTECNKRAKSR